MCWKAFAAKTALLSFVARKGSTRTSITLVEGVLEAGKKRLAGDTAREATSDEVKELKAEARQLKETLAEVLIQNRLLKKAFSGMGRTLLCIDTFIRKIRDHRKSGTVVALDPSDTGVDRHPEYRRSTNLHQQAIAA